MGRGLRATRPAGKEVSLRPRLPLIGLVFVAAIATALPGEAAPRRVVSFNLCADQLVIALADPQQIAGLSPYAADPALSVMADEARSFRRLDWQAEATISLQPDLVLVGPNDRPVTRRLLTAQKLRVLDVALVTDVAAARAQIAELAALLGHPERGEGLLAALAAAQARLAAVPRAPSRPRWWSSAAAIPQGPQSLAAALVAEAGLAPACRRADGIRRLHCPRTSADAQGGSPVPERSAAQPARPGRAVLHPSGGQGALSAGAPHRTARRA